jgi:hypothetical protein
VCLQLSRICEGVRLFPNVSVLADPSFYSFRCVSALLPLQDVETHIFYGRKDLLLPQTTLNRRLVQPGILHVLATDWERGLLTL